MISESDLNTMYELYKGMDLSWGWLVINQATPLTWIYFNMIRKCKYMYLPDPLEPFHILKSNCCKVNTTCSNFDTNVASLISCGKNTNVCSEIIMHFVSYISFLAKLKRP